MTARWKAGDAPVMHWPGTALDKKVAVVHGVHENVYNRPVYTVVCNGCKVVVNDAKLRHRLNVTVSWPSCGWWPDRGFWTAWATMELDRSPHKRLLQGL